MAFNPFFPLMNLPNLISVLVKMDKTSVLFLLLLAWCIFCCPFTFILCVYIKVCFLTMQIGWPFLVSSMLKASGSRVSWCIYTYSALSPVHFEILGNYSNCSVFHSWTTHLSHLLKLSYSSELVVHGSLSSFFGSIDTIDLWSASIILVTTCLFLTWTFDFFLEVSPLCLQ